MKYLFKNFISVFLLATFISIVGTSSSVDAMQIIGSKKIKSFDSSSKDYTLIYKGINKKQIKINFASLFELDAFRDYINIPVKDEKGQTYFNIVGVGCGSISASQIITDDKTKDFIMIQDLDPTGTPQAVHHFYIIGLYGDSYVKYVSLDELKKNAVIPEGYTSAYLKNGNIYIQVTLGNKETGIRKLYRLFWDENAQWFGIEEIQ